MPSTTKNTKNKNMNYVSSFKSALNRGTPFNVAIWNIAQRAGQTESWVYNHLYKHGALNRRKVNGNWIWWPNHTRNGGKKPTNTQFKNFSFQQIVAWAIATGYCTPEQVDSLKSQKDFYNFFGPFIAGQFNWTVKSGWTPTQVKSFAPNGTSTTSTRTRKTTRKAGSKAKSRRSTGAKSSRKRTTTRAKSTRRSTAAKSTRRSTAKSTRRSTAAKSTRRATAPKRRNTRTTTARGRKNTTAVRNYRFPRTSSNTASRTYRRAA